MIDGWTKIAHKDTNTQWIRYLEPPPHPCLPTGTNEGCHQISAYHFESAQLLNGVQNEVGQSWEYIYIYIACVNF